MDASERGKIWNQIWPGAATAASVWAIFYTLAIGPMQKNDDSLSARISYNDGRFVELFAFKAASIEWQNSHDRDMERIRSDLSAAILTSSRAVDRLNDRLDIVHNDLQRIIEHNHQDEEGSPYKGKGGFGG